MIVVRNQKQRAQNNVIGDIIVIGIRYIKESKVSRIFARITSQIPPSTKFIGIAKSQNIIDEKKSAIGIIIRNGKVIKAIKYLMNGQKAKNPKKFPIQKKY